MKDIKSITNSILSGKSLSEALNERAGDWDIEPEEMYSKSEEAQYEYEKEYREFIKASTERFSKFLSGMKALEDVLSMCYTYGVPYSDAKDCPFKNLDDVSKDCEKWVTNIKEMIAEGK